MLEAAVLPDINAVKQAVVGADGIGQQLRRHLVIADPVAMMPLLQDKPNPRKGVIDTAPHGGTRSGFLQIVVIFLLEFSKIVE